MEVSLGEIRAESGASVLERNWQHYYFVCRKLRRYMSPNFRARSRGQQPPRYRILNLIREALRLNLCLYNQEILRPGSLHADLVTELDFLTRNGTRETSRELALQMASDLCNFVCEEIK